MKKFFILVSALCLIFTSCFQQTKDTEVTENGQFTISFASPRMVQPDVDWKISDVTEWTANFTSTIDTTGALNFERTLVLSESDTLSTIIPVSTYNVKVTGFADSDNDGTTDYILYGYENNVELTTAGKSLTIYVSLSKRDETVGNFTYDLTVNQEAFDSWTTGAAIDTTSSTTAVSVLGKTLSAYLTLTSGDKTKIDLYATCESTAITEDAAAVTVKFVKSDIPVGFYYLTVKYGTEETDVITIKPDNIVEIAEGLTSSGTYEISEFEEKSVKTIYVTNDVTDESETDYNVDKNGVISTNSKGLNAAITWLSENKDMWDEANLNFVGSETPILNIDTNPTADTDADSRTVTLNWGSGTALKKIVFAKGETTLTTYDYDELSFTTASTTEKAFNLKTTSSEEQPLKIAQLTLENVVPTIWIDYASDENALTVTPAAYKAYTDENTAFLVINYGTEDKYDVGVADSEYTLLSKSSTIKVENYYSREYYTALAGTETVTLTRKIPKFTIQPAETGYTFKVEDAVDMQFVAKPEIDGVTFAEGTTFVWKINDNIQDSTGDSIILNLSTSDDVKIGENTITCIVSYDGESSSYTYGDHDDEEFVISMGTIR